MPQLAVFPKAFFESLCITGEMSLRQWIEMGATLDVDGLEFHSRFIELQSESSWTAVRHMAEDNGLTIPMMCCTPDFTHPDRAHRQAQIDQERRWIDMTAALGGAYCRILCGQERPGISRADGVRYAVESIESCLTHAQQRNVTLTLENHYQNVDWHYAEFSNNLDVLCELVERIGSSALGINFDPSNALKGGIEPLDVLDRLKHRVVTMHASDCYLKEEANEDLRREKDEAGYAQRFSNGVIGQGMNDYNKIFSKLSGVGFDGWISIEDGEEGMEQLRESVSFLRVKMIQWF